MSTSGARRKGYFTHEGIRVFYKQAVLHVKELGRARVFALREEGLGIQVLREQRYEDDSQDGPEVPEAQVEDRTPCTGS
jgi:hypothetical protein